MSRPTLSSWSTPMRDCSEPQRRLIGGAGVAGHDACRGRAAHREGVFGRVAPARPDAGGVPRAKDPTNISYTVGLTDPFTHRG